jgi:DNA repair protein RecO (recombination protein O)
MSKTYTTTGLILKRRDYLENDRLFIVYSKDFGKIELLAKGTKKISSKLNSYLEPFYLIKIMAARGKGFDKLANCNLVKSYQNLRNDQSLFGFYLLNYLSEVTDGLIIGQTLKNDKFQLLLELLDLLEEKINQASQLKLLGLVNVYNFKNLNLLGYQPEIKRCLNCHKGILLTKNIFDFRQGGIICEDCKKVCLIEDYILVSDGVIKLLQLAQEKSLADFISLENHFDDLKQFNQVVYKLLLINLEKPIKSVDFLNNFC